MTIDIGPNLKKMVSLMFLIVLELVIKPNMPQTGLNMDSLARELHEDASLDYREKVRQ